MLIGVGIVVILFKIFCTDDQGSSSRFSTGPNPAFNADWTDAIQNAKAPGSPRTSGKKTSSSNKRK